jgi:hypothetical protein
MSFIVRSHRSESILLTWDDPNPVKCIISCQKDYALILTNIKNLSNHA